MPAAGGWVVGGVAGDLAPSPHWPFCSPRGCCSHAPSPPIHVHSRELGAPGVWPWGQSWGVAVGEVGVEAGVPVEQKRLSLHCLWESSVDMGLMRGDGRPQLRPC